MRWFFHDQLKNTFNRIIICDSVIIPELFRVLQSPAFIVDTDIGGGIEA